MSRKDYIKFAAMLLSLRPDIDKCSSVPNYDGREQLWHVMVVKSANIFSEDNPHFDYNRYYTACGFE